MKKNIKRAYLFLATMLVVILGACSDDPEPDDNTGEVRKEGNETISSFTLKKAVFRIPDRVIDVTTRLVSVNQEGTDRIAAKCDTINLPARITVDDSRIRVEMRIPDDVVLDKEYLLTLHRAPGVRRYVGGVKATFKANRLCSIGAEAEPYRGLEGEGTEESPYLIENAEDYLSFLKNLYDDEMFHGEDLFFLQTADFDAPSRSGILDGRGYCGYEFAGSYDGGNYKINNLYYHGDNNSEKDVDVGLFPIVYGGAVIKNLTLSGVMIYKANNNVGALIGRTIDNGKCITINNVNISGSINDCSKYIGGLIGYARGRLVIDGCDIAVNITGAYMCGGIIGEFYGCDLEISNVTTKAHQISVNATTYRAGGIAGTIDVSEKMIFKNIRLQHTVSSEDADVKIIHSKDGLTGGLTGCLETWKGALLKLENIDILCPISSEYRVGGLVGLCNTKSDIIMNGCRVKGVISGDSQVGGWFGEFGGSQNIPVSLEFAGGDGANSFEADIVAAGVDARSEAGGLFGYVIDGPKMYGDRVKVAANVNASESRAGGVAGYACNTDIDASLFIMTNTMRVTGGREVGGLVGKSEYGSITDSRNPVFDVERTSKAYIPSKSQFTYTSACMVEGDNYVGGIVGYSESFLYCLASAATVTCHGEYSGGIAGYAGIYDGAPIQRCVFMDTVSCNGSYAGGIAGYLKNAVDGKNSGGFLRDCVNYGSVKGGNYTGGIAGRVDYSSGVRMELHWSVNLGDIDGGVPCGGLIGKCDGSNAGMGMVGLANYGDVKSTGNDEVGGVGGVIGSARSTHIDINGAMNKGNIHAKGHIQGIGGVVGILGQDPDRSYQEDNCEMYSSANYGNVSCDHSETYVGGLCGWLEEGCNNGKDAYIRNCYNIGEVSSDQKHDNGGLIGCIDTHGRIERCINFGKVHHGNATIGTKKTSTTAFDYSNLNMIEGSGNGWCVNNVVKASEQDQTSKYKGIYFDKLNWKMTNGRPHLSTNCFEGVIPPEN